MPRENEWHIQAVPPRLCQVGHVGHARRRLHDLYWAKREQGWHGTPVRYD